LEAGPELKLKEADESGVTGFSLDAFEVIELFISSRGIFIGEAAAFTIFALNKGEED
jgi:hypothetical protein|tara:strand:+ start:351 stop:521 length:171 start_codon:yes stop_codon:yes gene_type:complete